jgi:hypothetical protein
VQHALGSWKELRGPLGLRVLHGMCLGTDKVRHTLSFATDTWSTPNHKAFVAVTVHFEKKGISIFMLLDIIEVAKSHSEANLTAAFANILHEFGISKKVSIWRLL